MKMTVVVLYLVDTPVFYSHIYDEKLSIFYCVSHNSVFY